MYTKFIENQDSFKKTTQELERLRCGFGVKGKIERMQYEDLEEKERLSKDYLLILRCMF